MSQRSVVLRSHGKLRRASYVLLESTGLAARAHLVARDGSLGPSAESSTGDPLEDARRALQGLAQRVRRLPRRALLVSDDLSAQGLSLPRAIARRAPGEIHAAVGYELESEVAQRAGTRPLASLLCAMGAAPAELLEGHLAEQSATRASGLPGGGLPLGDRLVQHGVVPREAVGRALGVQAWLTGAEGALAAGWSWERVPGEKVEALAVAAVGQGGERRVEWLRLLRAAGLELAGALAHESAPTALLDQDSRVSGARVLHFTASWATLLILDKVRGLRVERSAARGVVWTVDELQKWAGDQVGGALHLAPHGPGARELARQWLSHRASLVLLGAPLAPPEAHDTLPGAGAEGAPDAEQHASPAALGAAAFLAQGGSSPELALLGRGAPRDRRLPGRVAAFVASLCLLVLGAVGAEYLLEERVRHTLAELEALSARNRAVSAERSAALEHNRRLDAARSERERISGSIAEIEVRFEATKAADAARQQVARERREFPHALLTAVARVVDAEVQLLAVETPRPGLLEVEVLATEPVAAENFLRQLRLELSPFGLEPLHARSGVGLEHGSALRVRALFERQEQP